MRLRQLGSSDIHVTELCLGTLTFGQPGWGCDEAEAGRIIDRYLAAGGNFLDTADIYAGGVTEEIVGRALKGRRQSVVLATKVGGRTGPGPHGEGASPDHIFAAVEASLRRLQTDYIDLYQLHHYDHATSIDATLEAFDHLVQSGKVLAVGCSNFFAWEAVDADSRARAHGRAPLAACQMMYNLVRRDLEREHFAMTAARRIALLTYSPLHSGILAGAVERNEPAPSDARVAAHPFLRSVYLGDEERAWLVVDAVKRAAKIAGRSMSEIALGWVIRQDAIASVIIGARGVAELDANLAVLDLDVPQSVWDELDRDTQSPPTYPTDFYRRLVQRAEAR